MKKNCMPLRMMTFLLGKISSGLNLLLPNGGPHPLHVQWFLTGVCNYRCPSCLVWLQPFKKELVTEEIKRGINILNELKVADLTFTGGNPLLRRDIGEVLEYAHEKFPVVTIYDNGSLAYKKIDALKHADRVCISLNTFKEDMQNIMSGAPRAFQDAHRSIDALEKEGISVVVSITISEANMDEVPNLVEHFGERGIPMNFSLYNETSLEDGAFKIGTSVDEFKFRRRERLVMLLEQLKDFKKRYPLHLDSRTIDSARDLYSNGKRNWQCQALTSFFTVNEVGDVSGCHVHRPLCKIWDLPDLWKSDGFDKTREHYHNCEMCTYMCYIAYSQMKTVGDLFYYAWDYESHNLRKLFH
ncbi:MAG: radical SAM protein [Candidatus Bathyarchaeia archaeon]